MAGSFLHDQTHAVFEMSLGGPNLIQYMFFGALDKSGAMNGKVTAHLGCLLGYIFEGMAPGHFGAKKSSPGRQKKVPRNAKNISIFGTRFLGPNLVPKTGPPGTPLHN